MKLRKLLVIGLLSGSMVLSSTGSVLASEEYTREVKCKVGATLTMGEVVQVLKDEDKVVKLENGKVNLLKEGDCLVVLSTGETIHLVVMNEDNPETSELGKGVIAEIPAEEEEQEVNDAGVSSDSVKESEVVEDVESEAESETVESKIEAETEVEKKEATPNKGYADVKEETEKEAATEDLEGVEGIDTGESEKAKEIESKGNKDISEVIESETEVKVPLASKEESTTESLNSDEVVGVEKEARSEKSTEVETQEETNSQVNTKKESETESIEKTKPVLDVETETEVPKTVETKEESETSANKESEKGVKEPKTSIVNEKELGDEGFASNSGERETEVNEVSKETETPSSEDVKKETETSNSEDVKKETETEVKNKEFEKETEPTVEDTKLGLDDINPDAPLDEGAVIDDTVPLTSDIDTSKSKDGTTTAETTSKIRESSHTGVVGTYFVLPILEGEAGEYISTNEDVARVSSDGVVYFSGVGEAKIIVSAQDKIYTCNVTSLNPEFDNSDVILDWDVGSYAIELGGDYLGEKISYSIVSGEDIASVSEDGVVTFSGSGTVIVRASVAGMEFNKRIIQNSRRKKLWDDMQGAIQQCLGTPYVFGGFAPGSGLDCSGYVSYVYNTVGLMSGRTSAQGLYNMFGLTSNPQPGDVVYFAGTYDCPDYITHVGIYAGDGMMYHSGKPNQKTAIVGYYAEHLVGYGSITGE